jgi:hypothetical protein
LKDTECKEKIIGGLTQEILDRLIERDSIYVKENQCRYTFNSEELKIELDNLIREHEIRPRLHTYYCAALKDNDRIDAVIIENKNGRFAIRAKMFVDATGDGDVAMHAGIPWKRDPLFQPPTTCAKIQNIIDTEIFRELYGKYHKQFNLQPDNGWQTFIPGLKGISMFAQTHVFDAFTADADELTFAEMEGRRQIRASMDMVRQYGPKDQNMQLVALASSIGVRETRRFDAEYILTEEDVLWGKRFPDAIANGSYCVDVHYSEGGGTLFKFLDGRQIDTRNNIHGRWRDPIDKNPTFWQIPYRTMIYRNCRNLIMAGRMIAADRGAFGAIRVMVNMNQVGEAAGVAAAMATRQDCDVQAIDADDLRAKLQEGASIMK